ncbi:hypothetical protein ColLi_11335 [Colletotrichum liriopes]|uniref:Uncharacterized protein n=1 Tax=Colletotrichum liriopes TaxID=708192 RepID=A0AA37LXN7_9PEZI|nr:hypothetical protein ColLi_11335 [Colletotrichum liriopes]
MRRLRTSDVAAQNQFFEAVANAIAVWNYLNHPDVLPTVQDNRQNIIDAARLIATLITEFASLEALVMEFDDAWYENAADRTRTWVDEMLDEMEQGLAPLILSGRAPPNTSAIVAMIASMRNLRGDIRAPPRKKKP